MQVILGSWNLRSKWFEFFKDIECLHYFCLIVLLHLARDEAYTHLSDNLLKLSNGNRLKFISLIYHYLAWAYVVIFHIEPELMWFWPFDCFPSLYNSNLVFLCWCDLLDNPQLWIFFLQYNAAFSSKTFWMNV